jgi:hypothetical protein
MRAAADGSLRRYIRVVAACRLAEWELPFECGTFGDYKSDVFEESSRIEGLACVFSRPAVQINGLIPGTSLNCPAEG